MQLKASEYETELCICWLAMSATVWHGARDETATLDDLKAYAASLQRNRSDLDLERFTLARVDWPEVIVRLSLNHLK
jgi:hypothetical protein